MKSSGPRPPKSPTARDFQDDYFAELYGDVPRQTLPDLLRDLLVRRLVTHHCDGGRLLEIGCGFGYLLGGFDTRWTLYGTDISDHAARVAQRRLPRARILAADVQEGVPFEGRFRAVVAVNVMEHLPEPERAAKSIVRAVEPGGLFVAHLPVINGALSRWIYDRTYDSDPTHIYWPSGGEFSTLMENAGFETLQALYFPFRPLSLWRWIQPHPAFLGVFRRTIY